MSEKVIFKKDTLEKIRHLTSFSNDGSIFIAANSSDLVVLSKEQHVSVQTVLTQTFPLDIAFYDASEFNRLASAFKNDISALLTEHSVEFLGSQKFVIPFSDKRLINQRKPLSFEGKSFYFDVPLDIVELKEIIRCASLVKHEHMFIKLEAGDFDPEAGRIITIATKNKEHENAHSKAIYTKKISDDEAIEEQNEQEIIISSKEFKCINIDDENSEYRICFLENNVLLIYNETYTYVFAGTR